MSGATTPDERWRLGYRPALDGLRGVAVLLVVIAHTNVPIPRFASIGVTLFFALSGFLITALLLEERERSGRIHLRAFYRRRALRLVPAMVVVLIAVAAWMAATGRGDRILGDIGPAATYTSNWFIALGGAGDLGLVRHTWSLAVEEQFYLLWPAVLMLALWRGVSPLAILGIGIVGSVLLRAVLFDPMEPQRVMWAFDTRVDAILAGCALAILTLGGWRAPRYTGWLGMALLVSVVILANDDGALAYWALTAIALGSVLCIAALLQGPSVLTWRPLIGFGKISYGLYLWHQPIFKEGGRLLADLPQPVLAVSLMFLAFAVAAASYHWIETPWLRRRHREGEHPARSGRPLAGPPTPRAAEGSLRARAGASP